MGPESAILRAALTLPSRVARSCAELRLLRSRSLWRRAEYALDPRRAQSAVEDAYFINVAVEPQLALPTVGQELTDSRQHDDLSLHP